MTKVSEQRRREAERVLRKHLEWEATYLAFVIKNPRFPYITPNGVKLRLIPEGDKIRLAILVDESTNRADIASAETWQVIKEWRERLAKFQGPFSVHPIIEAMMKHHEDGYSYGEIAKVINDDLANALKSLMTPLEENEQDLRAFDQAFIIGHLRYLRFKDQDIMQFITDGMERISEGRPPFNPDMPISGTKVKAILQHQKKKS